VITVGGDDGTMGFVDYYFSRGILFCNVLQADCPRLYYVPLPAPPHHRWPDRNYRRCVCGCGIAVVDTEAGRCIRFVELCPCEGNQGWRAVTWSRSAADYLKEGWSQDFDIVPSQLVINGDLPEQLAVPREPFWPSGKAAEDLPYRRTTRDIYRMHTE
jgi:hypothetical protein